MYGYIPDSSGTRAAIFVSMTLFSAFTVLVRSFGMAFMLEIGQSSSAPLGVLPLYFTADHVLFWVYKLVRGDFIHWAPTEGLVLSVLVSCFSRWTVKVHSSPQAYP